MDYGNRFGSSDKKQSGYMGPLNVPGTNDIATEYSIDLELRGKPMQIPAIVPTLTKNEVSILLESIKNNMPLPDEIINKAVEHALSRLSQGKSPFWKIPEKQSSPMPNDLLKDSLHQPTMFGIPK